MAMNLSNAQQGLMDLIDIKAPLAPTTDGGFALTLGTNALNAGIKFGGNSAVEVWAEAGPLYARAGITNTLGVYGVAGFQAGERTVGVIDPATGEQALDDNGNPMYATVPVNNEVGAYAGFDGVAAYVDAPSFNYFGAAAFSGSGFATFATDKATGQIVQKSGTAEAAAAANQLIGGMAAFQGPASIYVPSLAESLGGLEGLFGIGSPA